MTTGTPEAKTVLIVDDDPALARSFKRALREEPFSLLIASDGEQALSYLDSVQVDMVIADIRMKKIDGYEFLSEVRQRKPGVIRIVYSGYTERQSMVKIVAEGVAGAYLTKPCPMSVLKTHIKRFLDLGARLNRYREKWGSGDLNVKEIPLQAATYNRLMTMIRNNSSMEDLARFLARDPVLVSGILATANSAFYGSNIGSVKEALLIMGLNTVRNIVITVELFNLFSGSSKEKKELLLLKKHAELSGALFNSLYAELSGKKTPDEISCCGLLHDIGAIVMLVKMPDLYRAARKRLVAAPGEDIRTVERSECGLDHQELGAFVLDMFNMPYPIIECAMHHHDPFEAPESEKFLCALVHVAAAYAHGRVFGPGPPADVEESVFDMISEQRSYIEEVVKKVVSG
ncbi:MAG: HDOD domain-containing protein [Desulfobacteraceae bacterium]